MLPLSWSSKRSQVCRNWKQNGCCRDWTREERETFKIGIELQFCQMERSPEPDDGDGEDGFKIIWMASYSWTARGKTEGKKREKTGLRMQLPGEAIQGPQCDPYTVPQTKAKQKMNRVSFMLILLQQMKFTNRAWWCSSATQHLEGMGRQVTSSKSSSTT